MLNRALLHIPISVLVRDPASAPIILLAGICIALVCHVLQLESRQVLLDRLQLRLRVHQVTLALAVR